MLCEECGRLSADAEESCWRCGRDSLYPMSRFGEIFSYTTVFTEKEPFVLALVELPCGKLVTARIIDIRCDLRIGLPVEFRPATSRLSESGGLFFSPLMD